ncbi:MAG: MFS transporter [Hyphomicrobiales bacterium]|nr:MFS transporter [Hyphomicrobiales bacterium]
MLAIRPLIPLLIAAGILLAGNGLQGTLIAIRGTSEGFSTLQIGAIGAGYFLGFMMGALVVSRMLQAVGHIRLFSAMAAIAASGTLILIMLVDPLTWFVLRVLMGFCFACLFATVDSWINSGVSNDIRAKVLSVYRIVDIACVTGSQFLIPFFGSEGFVIFAVMAIMVSISLVPISLADRSNPRQPSQVSFSLDKVWRISPIACIGCIAIGLTGATFRLVGPVYAQSIGMSIASVATFMSAGIFGGAVLQYPLGWLSDKYGRREVLIIATLGAAAAGFFITNFASDDHSLNMLGIFLFGAFSLPLYSLSAAHANDHASKDEFIQIAAGLMFFWSIGAIIGPVAGSYMMELYGPSVLFYFTSVIHTVLAMFTLWRMWVRGVVPREKRTKFAMLLRTSPMMMKLTRKSNPKARR